MYPRNSRKNLEKERSLPTFCISRKFLAKTVFRTVFFLLIIIIFGFGSADKTYAAVFNDAVNGNWNIGTTWGTGCASSCVEGVTYPGPNDTVIINSNTVTLSADQSSASTTIATGGTLNLGTYTLNVYNNFNHSAGTFNANTGTVNLAGTNQQIIGASTFYNLTKATTTVSDTLYMSLATTTVTNQLTLTGSESFPLTVKATTTEWGFYRNFGTDWAQGGFLNSPGSVAIDANDNVYIAERVTGRISKFDSSGNFLSFVGTYGTNNGQLAVPTGVAVATSTGAIFTYDAGQSRRMQKFDSSGQYVTKFGFFSSPTVAAGQLHYNSSGVAVDFSGNVYVANGVNRIDKFNSSGTFLYAFGWGVVSGTAQFEICTTTCVNGIAGSGTGQFNNPHSVAVDNMGNVYVADGSNNRIQKFDSSGNFISMFGWGVNTGASALETCASGCRVGLSGTGNGQISGASALTVDASGNIYVAENYRVQKFNSSFAYVTKWTGIGYTGSISNLATDSQGNVYIPDTDVNNLKKYSSTGTLLSVFGVANSAVEGMLYNTGYNSSSVVDSSGNLYVTENRNNRVSKFDSNGNFVAMYGWGVATGASQFETCTTGCKIGLSGSGNGQFAGPSGLSIDASGNFYVTSGGNRIQKFNSSFVYVSSFGTYGSGAGQLNNPTGTAIDASGNIYVAEAGQHRVSKFNSSGSFVATFGWGVATGASQYEVCTTGCVAGIAGTGNGQFNQPRYVAVDSAGNVYVTSYTGTAYVRKFDSNLNWLSNNSVAIINLTGIYVDSLGNVYLTGGDSNTYTNNLMMYDSAFNLKAIISPGGISNGGLKPIPSSNIFQDTHQNMFVVDNVMNRAVQYHPLLALNVQGTSVVSNVTLHGAKNVSTGVLSCVDCTDTGYNSRWSFTSSRVPTVSVGVATAATTTATMNGEIVDIGGGTPTIRGFDFGTTTSYGSATSTTGSYSTGAYSLDLSDLSCGTTYHFRSFATNSNGTGTSTDATFTTTTCPSAPSGPQSLSITTDSGLVNLRWSVPASSGGYPITDYLVQYKPTLDSDWLTFSDGVSTLTNTTVTSLTNGISYDFRVSAINSMGTGSPSATSTIFVGLYNLTSGPYTVTDLGSLLQSNSPERQIMYRTSDNHRHAQLYWDTFGTYDDNWMDIDIDAQTFATGTLVSNKGRLSPNCQVYYPANNKTYVGSGDPGSLSEIDPVTGTSRYIHLLSYKGSQYCEVGDDGWIYVGELTSAGHPGAGLERYNPLTDTWQDLGIIDPTFAGSLQYAYTLGADSRYVFIGLGQLPWYLAVYDTQTSTYTTYWADQNDTGGTVVKGSDGAWYYTRTNPVTGNKKYNFINGVPHEVSSTPSLNAWYYHGNVVNDLNSFQTVFGAQINMDGAHPNNGNGGIATIGYQADSGPWYYATTAGFTLKPTTIKRIYNWPGDPTKIFGWEYEYGVVFSYDISSGGVTSLGYPQKSLYDATFDGNIFYLSGYAAATLRYDSTKPWTLTPTVNVSSSTINPYQISLLGGDSAGSWNGKYDYYSDKGSDGFIYIGVHHERDSTGGGLGWYNPITGATGGLRQPFLTYDVRDLLAVNGGNKIVYSSSGDTLFILDVATKQIERTIIPIPGTSTDKIVESETPGVIVGIAGTKFWRVNVLTGEVIYVKDLGGTAFTGIASYDRRLIKGPDGYVWLFIGNTLSRINPINGVIESVKSGMTVNNIMFNGGDMYMYGGTNIYRISNLLLTTIPTSYPVISASSATSVSTSTAVIHGSIDDIGGSTPTTRGFQYGVTSAYGTSVSTNGSFGAGSYSANLTGLACGTTYHFKSYATNSSGSGGSSDVTFTTDSCPLDIPVVTMSDLSSITSTSATLNGSISSTGGVDPTTRGFQYGLTSAYGTVVSTNGSYSTGAFSASVSNLTCATTYHIRSFATNTLGTGYSPDVIFVTNDCPITTSITSPANPTISDVSKNSLVLSWGPSLSSLGIRGYNVYRNGTQVSYLHNSQTYTDTGLSANTSYSYTISAVDNGDNESDASSAITATTDNISTTNDTTSGSRGNGMIVGKSFSFLNAVKPRSQIVYPDGTVVYTDTPSGTTTPEVGTGYVSPVSISHTLSVGMKGSEVVSLQDFLIQKGYLSKNISPIGLFGQQTRRAVQKFQCDKKIVCSGSENTSGYGFVGKKTLLAINSSNNSLPAMVEPSVPQQASTTGYKFVRTLSLGMTGQDVKQLQVYLNAHGFLVAPNGPGSVNNETERFGAGTYAALIKFQEAHADTILIPNGLIKGNGFFGKSTMEEVNRSAD
ncbi:MAG: tripartite motif-containing protein 71 [Patescibacteria group bacterium]|nr:tripartite motif-containing protein 71 [Patescibacteria group bacterium]